MHLIKMPQYQEIENGDLFTSQDSMCHCVSVDLSMSAGIATIFKERYKRVAELKDQMVEIGGVATLFIPEEGRFL